MVKGSHRVIESKSISIHDPNLVRELLLRSSEVLKRCSVNISRNQQGRFGTKTESFCERTTVDAQRTTRAPVSWPSRPCSELGPQELAAFMSIDKLSSTQHDPQLVSIGLIGQESRRVNSRQQERPHHHWNEIRSTIQQNTPRQCYTSQRTQRSPNPRLKVVNTLDAAHSRKIVNGFAVAPMTPNLDLTLVAN